MLINIKSGLEKGLISGDLLLFDNYEWALYIEPKNTNIAPLFVMFEKNDYDLIEKTWFHEDRFFITGESGNTYEIIKRIPKEKLELREI